MLTASVQSSAGPQARVFKRVQGDEVVACVSVCNFCDFESQTKSGRPSVCWCLRVVFVFEIHTEVEIDPHSAISISTHTFHHMTATVCCEQRHTFCPLTVRIGSIIPFCSFLQGLIGSLYKSLNLCVTVKSYLVGYVCHSNSASVSGPSFCQCILSVCA